MLDRLAILPAKAKPRLEMRVGRRRIRIEVDRPAKRRDRLLGAPFHHGPIAKRDVPPGIAIIEGDRPHGVLAAGRASLDRDRSTPCARQTPGKNPAGFAPARSPDRPRRPVRGRRSQSRSPARVRRQKCVCARATSSQAPRSSAERESARTPSAASRWGSIAAATLRVISSCTAKMSPSFAVVAFGPVMAAGRRVDELRADAQLLAGPAHAAFEHVADAKLARDLLHIDRAALVDERRVAGDDEQPADAGQPGDQVLGDAVGKILLIGIAAHIGERQHRDRGTVGQRQRRCSPCAEVSIRAPRRMRRGHAAFRPRGPRRRNGCLCAAAS